jgi:hypothetical protein
MPVRTVTASANLSGNARLESRSNVGLLMCFCFSNDSDFETIYEGESVNRSQMEVNSCNERIGFLSALLGSSTVQLHDSLGIRGACACLEADFSSQNGDRAWGVNTEERRSGVCFLRERGLSAKDIHKEMLPVYGRKCLSRKAIHNWVANVSLMTKRLKRRFRSSWDNNQKTSILRVSTHR